MITNELFFSYLVIAIVVPCLTTIIVIYEANRIIKGQNEIKKELWRLKETMVNKGLIPPDEGNQNNSDYNYVRIRSMDDMREFTENKKSKEKFWGHS